MTLFLPQYAQLSPLCATMADVFLRYGSVMVEMIVEIIAMKITVMVCHNAWL